MCPGALQGFCYGGMPGPVLRGFFGKEMLMHFLGWVELRGGAKLRHNGPVVTVHLHAYRAAQLSRRLLLGAMVEDCGTELFADIRSLFIQLSRIVAGEKYLQ